MNLSVRDVDENVFREFKAETVREKMALGEAVTLAMKVWLDRIEKKPKNSILNIKKVRWQKGSERTSEEVDDILYGKG
ncbi:MAG: hypothetical protein V1870_02375 [Candidatus Aenigmatarchaeota archaeon]